MMSIVSTPPIIMFSCRQMVGCKGLSFYGLPLFTIKKRVWSKTLTPLIVGCSYYLINNMKKL
jgi:hypothetical protein